MNKEETLSEEELAVVRGSDAHDFFKQETWNNYARGRQQKSGRGRFSGFSNHKFTQYGEEVQSEESGFFKNDRQRHRGVIERIEIENRTLTSLSRIAKKKRCSLYDVCRDALRNYVANAQAEIG